MGSRSAVAARDAGGAVDSPAQNLKKARSRQPKRLPHRISLIPLRQALLAWALLAAVERQAAAVELEIHYGALQRILAEQMFTQDGRKYVRGTPAARCSFAYLEHPELRGDGNGRLRVKARFSGRSALDVLGKCVGMGDSFDLEIAAVPYFHNGAIRFKDVLVESKKDGFYIRRVRAALTATLRNQFEYKVAEDARKILEEKRGNYSRELKAFQVSSVRVTGDALVLSLDFTLAVK